MPTPCWENCCELTADNMVQIAKQPVSQLQQLNAIVVWNRKEMHHADSLP
jgi:hypothetical protein